MGWLEWTAVVVVCAFVWWRFLRRRGNLEFWRLAARHPDLVFVFFKAEKCWFLDEVPAGLASSDLTGPFRFFIPSLGRHVKVWGRHPDYVESQARFIEGLKRNPIHGFLGK